MQIESISNLMELHTALVTKEWEEYSPLMRIKILEEFN